VGHQVGEGDAVLARIGIGERALVPHERRPQSAQSRTDRK
jgi:hypothetical protein